MNARFIGSLLTLLAAGVFLTGCSSVPTIDSGTATVVSKQFSPAHTEQLMTMAGDVPIMIPMQIPDRYKLTVVQGETSDSYFTFIELYEAVEPGSKVCIKDGLIDKINACSNAAQE